MSGSRVLAIVPAHNEQMHIAATVEALRAIGEIDEVLVVDDGSSDATAKMARQAGARVLVTGGDIGKGWAVEGAVRRSTPADVYVFADGDLGSSASGLRPVLAEVLEGRADLAVAVLPSQSGGGFGRVKRFAADAIFDRTRIRPAEPLSGQRAITSGALDACRPLAYGFGMETAMTIDALRAGFRFVEVPTNLRHDPPGRTPAGFLHRGRQGLDIARALRERPS